MPAHCANNVNPDVAARRRSCAADIETVGVSENGVLDYGGAGSIHTRTPPKVSFADDGDIIGTSESAVRHVSFARDIEIICESLGKDEGNDNKTDKPIDGPRKVSFVDDVEIIGQSEHYDSVYTEVEALDFNADGLFEADGFFFTTHEIGNNLSNVVVNGIGETLTGDEYAHFATDENYSPAPRLLSPPPRHSSINWRRNVSYQHLRPVDMAPPTMGRLLQPDRTPPSVTLSPLALPPPLIPLDGVEPLVISPPPAYVTGDDEILETEIEDTAIMALRSPVPTYNDDIRPPEYSVDAYSVRDVDDIVLEEVFSDVGAFFRGVGSNFANAWRAFTHDYSTGPAP